MSSLSKVFTDYAGSRVLEALADVVFVIDVEGYYKNVFTKFPELLAAPVSDLTGKNLIDFFPEPTRKALMETLNEAIERGKTGNVKYPMEIDGETRWFEGRFVSISEKEVLFFVFDITQSYLSQKKLANSQANLNFILDNTEQAFFLVHKDSRLIDANRSGYRLLSELGLPSRQPGEKMSEILPEVFIAELSNAFVNALNGKNTHVIKEFNINSQVYHFRIEIAPICGSDQKPNIIAIGILDDTSQWKSDRKLLEAERNLSFFADNIDDIIWQISADGTLLYLSSGIEKLLGYLPESMLGRSILELVAPASRHIFNQLIDSGFSNDVDLPRKFEMQLLHANGSVRWGEVNYIVRNGFYTRQMKIIGILSDITLRRESERILQATSQRLLELNKTKDKFMSLIAHDLRNPLNAIKGFTELLIEDFSLISDGEKKQYLNTISNSSSELLRLLDDLLVWSRTQMGTISFNPEVIEVDIIVNEALIISQASALKKGIRLVSKVEAGKTVYADANMVRTILRNLIGNAVKFSFHDGVVCVTETDDGKFVTLSVSDHGIGLPHGHDKEVFIPDIEKHLPGTDGERGSGFGLVITREFVQYHKGTLSFEANYPEGTIVSFSLPATESGWKSGK